MFAFEGDTNDANDGDGSSCLDVNSRLLKLQHLRRGRRYAFEAVPHDKRSYIFYAVNLLPADRRGGGQGGEGGLFRIRPRISVSGNTFYIISSADKRTGFRPFHDAPRAFPPPPHPRVKFIARIKHSAGCMKSCFLGRLLCRREKENGDQTSFGKLEPRKEEMFISLNFEHPRCSKERFGDGGGEIHLSNV